VTTTMPAPVIAPGAALQLSGAEWVVREIMISMAGPIAERIGYRATTEAVVAVHEAGHAVVAFLTGKRHDAVSIIPWPSHSLGRLGPRRPTADLLNKPWPSDQEMTKDLALLGGCELAQVEAATARSYFRITGPLFAAWRKCSWSGECFRGAGCAACCIARSEGNYAARALSPRGTDGTKRCGSTKGSRCSRKPPEFPISGSFSAPRQVTEFGSRRCGVDSTLVAMRNDAPRRVANSRVGRERRNEIGSYRFGGEWLCLKACHRGLARTGDRGSACPGGESGILKGRGGRIF
jgi:hypothetical protein